MPIEMVLPATTRRIKAKSIPELFASAIHPEVSDELKGTDVELLQSMRWCATVDDWMEHIERELMRGDLSAYLTRKPIKAYAAKYGIVVRFERRPGRNKNA